MKPEARRSVSAAALKNNRSDFLVERLRSFTRESRSCVIFVILLQPHNVPVNFFFIFFLFFLTVSQYLLLIPCSLKKNAMRCFFTLMTCFWVVYPQRDDNSESFLAWRHTRWMFEQKKWLSSNESRADAQTNQLSKSLTKKSPKNLMKLKQKGATINRVQSGCSPERIWTSLNFSSHRLNDPLKTHSIHPELGKKKERRRNWMNNLP